MPRWFVGKIDTKQNSSREELDLEMGAANQKV